MPVGTTSRQGSNLGVKVINMILAPLNRYTCYGAIEVVAIIIIIIIITCVLLLGTIILRMLHDMLRYLSLQDIQRINRLSSVYIKIRVWLRLT